MVMTNKEILGKAIQKAIDSGWKAPSLLLALYQNQTGKIKGQNVEMVRGMITSHDFAKALWGEEKLDRYNPETDTAIDSLWDGGPEYFDFLGKTWQYHLQQMVISEDPIKYLGENI